MVRNKPPAAKRSRRLADLMAMRFAGAGRE
jgi:hypothetical protein